jgi:hypothetical protein
MSHGVAERFARETADHKMTVLHDDGLYRHLRFMSERMVVPWRNPQRSSMYWFELITVPGSLIFRGDGESFVFARIDDMFEFFRSPVRGPVVRINPDYWAGKVTSSRDRIQRYDHELFETRVKEAFVDAARHGGVPAGTGRALREQVLDEAVYCDERYNRDLLYHFEHDGFRFHDTDEWDFQDYDWWFLWALHGIVWGIAQYDASRRRPVVDVELPVGAAS